ncbi:hypothetical protein M404DRAFT_1008421 [Pisolithus tinctorius Marx 270]|uniref:Uncharacterized protein n=1 Tax=Pisolithus tinctorius Marx 270 TaxID=870435 RepID=A0A0C3MZT1_PISTI|nr:hypothetical protein M404DRAFT_1008421 [Pisolithus tinctorius Marx 270]
MPTTSDDSSLICQALVFVVELPESASSSMMSVMGHRILCHGYWLSHIDQRELPSVKCHVLLVDQDFSDEPCNWVVASDNGSIFG